MTYESVEDAEQRLGPVVENFWTEWPGFVQLEVAKGRALLDKETTPTSYAGPVVTVESVLAGPPWVTDGN